MATNPLVTQGVLNRLRGSLQFSANPQLNVTAGFLSKAGITLALQGDASIPIATMTGLVQSGEPYRIAHVTVPLLKTQGLSAAWKAQEESNTQIGDCTFRADASTIGNWQLSNCGIMGVTEITASGTDATYNLRFFGIYYVNSALWSLLS